MTYLLSYSKHSEIHSQSRNWKFYGIPRHYTTVPTSCTQAAKNTTHKKENLAQQDQEYNSNR